MAKGRWIYGAGIATTTLLFAFLPGIAAADDAQGGGGDCLMVTWDAEQHPQTTGPHGFWAGTPVPTYAILMVSINESVAGTPVWLTVYVDYDFAYCIPPGP